MLTPQLRPVGPFAQIRGTFARVIPVGAAKLAEHPSMAANPEFASDAFLTEIFGVIHPWLNQRWSPDEDDGAEPAELGEPDLYPYD